MPVNFVRRTFDRWLAQNIGRFRHRPIIVKQRKHYFILRFNGLTDQLQCFIGWKWQVEIHALHDGELWDILTDFDLVERRTPEGSYRCTLCLEPIDYPSRESLWVNEAFERLLSWIDEKLATAETLSIYESPDGGARYAKLSKAGEVGAENHEWFVATRPVLVPLDDHDAIVAVASHREMRRRQGESRDTRARN